ncbi:hypothetical protein [Botrimarina hoheduenensis]|uniref:Sodium Bile acid symporter family protein n=1 Tax=Botrimarina hoheduenensis TaxID=2528000 RepID=A0A5C5VXR5_9BACT|nr:hypothetical protein [Botrimarina hoheduenensis]TWT43438.1 Sodium Bile acid symporter family protein [Botrimarina hoheduenensis]
MSGSSSLVATLSGIVRRWLLVLLLGTYAAAAFAPGPGLLLRDASFGVGSGGEAARFSLWMVAVLLLCGGAMSDASRVRELGSRPFALLLALLGSWVVPLVVAIVTVPILLACLPSDQAVSIGLGLALAAAMPVANSAVAWTHQSDGAIPWSLGLVIISIGLCPWVAPLLLSFMGLTLSAAQSAAAEAVVVRSSGVMFMVWVLGPTALGLVVGGLLGPAGRRAAGPWLALASALALLLLNYANAAAALPQLLSEARPQPIFAAAGAALALPLSGAVAGWGLAPWGKVSHQVRIAWAYSLGMKNTGLALGLAGALLGDAPLAVLVILLVTLTQHAVAGGVHAVASRAHSASSASSSGLGS